VGREEFAIVKTVKIRGMSCQHCVKAVIKVLGEIEGVSDVQVDLDKGEATFEEMKPVALELLQEAIKKAGFELV
jgi:copper chaperone